MGDFVRSFGVGGFPHVADTGNEIWARYDVFGQPTFAFIDDDGSVDVTRLGGGDLAARLEALIAS